MWKGFLVATIVGIVTISAIFGSSWVNPKPTPLAGKIAWVVFLTFFVFAWGSVALSFSKNDIPGVKVCRYFAAGLVLTQFVLYLMIFAYYAPMKLEYKVAYPDNLNCLKLPWGANGCDWKKYEWIVDKESAGLKDDDIFGTFMVQTQQTIMEFGAIGVTPVIAAFVFAPFFGEAEAEWFDIGIDIADVGDFFGNFFEDKMLIDYWGWGSSMSKMDELLFGSKPGGNFGKYHQEGTAFTAIIQNTLTGGGTTWFIAFGCWTIAALYATITPLSHVFAYFEHESFSRETSCCSRCFPTTQVAAKRANAERQFLSLILLEVPFLLLRTWLLFHYKVPLSVMAFKNVSQIIKESLDVLIYLKPGLKETRCIKSVAYFTRGLDVFSGSKDAGEDDATNDSGSASDVSNA